jgi:hypothetical protein
MKNAGILLLALSTIIAMAQGCDNHADNVPTPFDDNQGELTDAEIDGYLDRLQDSRAVTDDSYATGLMEELEALSDTAKAQLIDSIEDYIGRHARAAGDLATAELALTASIRVSWSWWPSGKLPSSVGTTTACGGDTDLSVGYSNVAGAYSKPSALKLSTNSVYVWGIMAIHGYQATAYDITPSNSVKLCIGVKGAAGIWGISASLKGMFWVGLWIQ